MMPFGSAYGWGIVGWILGAALTVAFWVAVALFIVWLVRTIKKSGHETGGQQSPLDIAKSRYARGEITKEQFEQLKKDLG